MNTPRRISVLIADDHPIVREGLALLIERNEDMTVVAQASDGEEAVALFQIHRPDVTLMDLSMPRMDGVSAIEAIRKDYPTANILVLTTYDGDEDIYRGLHAGAKGYLLKDATRDQLFDGVRSLFMGQNFIPAPIAAKLAERVRFHTLTPREMEVLQLMMEGKTNHQIAKTLYIVEGTVKSHVNSILAKMGVSDRTQAVTTALRRGLVRLT
jgi:two-component system NarL family response regulator